MELVSFTPQTVKSMTLPMQEMRLMPIGDIQYGAQGCDVERLKAHLKWGMEQNCYFIGMGDYVDQMSPSNRKAYSSIMASLYDSAREAVDEGIEAKRKELEKILAPTKGRWLGLIQGHHQWVFASGDTTDSRLAGFLGCPLLGDCAMVVLRMESLRRGKGGRSGTGSKLHVPVKIWAHHGQGSGQTAAAALTKLEHAAKRFFADIYLMGHYHTKPAVPVPWIDFDVDAKGRVRFNSRNRYLVATGGFLKGYEEGTKNAMGLPTGSYIEKAMLAPVTLGGPVIYIRPRERSGRPSVDINVSI